MYHSHFPVYWFSVELVDEYIRDMKLGKASKQNISKVKFECLYIIYMYTGQTDIEQDILWRGERFVY